MFARLIRPTFDPSYGLVAVAAIEYLALVQPDRINQAVGGNVVSQLGVFRRLHQPKQGRQWWASEAQRNSED